MGRSFKIEFQGLEEFLTKLERASKGNLKDEMKLWIEALGFEFLDIVQDEIIRLGVVDTRLLLNSFAKGGEDNVWKVSHGGLTLEVGTNVYYAGYVNDGHWTNKKGVQQRFVPGKWSNGKFTYNPGSDSGMMLKQKWIEGYHYWESASFIFERVFAKSLERKVQKWLEEYFGMGG